LDLGHPVKSGFVILVKAEELVRMDVARVRRLVRPLPQPAKARIKRWVFRASVRPTDVFLVGHPKSGNTWLAYMLAIATRGGDGDGQVTMANVGDTVPTIHGDDSKVFHHRSLPDPRIFRNERPSHPELYPRAVYLVRDPRAMLVSYYHHYRAKNDDDETDLDAFVVEYLSQGHVRDYHVGLRRWDAQVSEWLWRASWGPVMIVRYEDLHDDRRGMLDKILGFCGLSFPSEIVEAAVDRGSFDAMRRDEEEHGAESYPWEPGRGPRFLRKGRVDGWREELSPGSVRAIEREMGPTMEALGYAPGGP
jgi:hypothetical protein